MTRRTFLQFLAQSWLVHVLPRPVWARPEPPITRHPSPRDPDWPRLEEWKRLSGRLSGRLLQPTAPDPATLTNPFALEDQAGATQSQGWQEAWASTPSPYAVAAESAQDVVEAVRFARKYRLRLVVKGTGHDYLGRSCASDSLLIWTHPMRKVEMAPEFRPQGAPSASPSKPAVHLQAGARWLEAYGEVTTRNGRYVQGGGCASVGAAGGFPLGGGFGSFSKKFGTGAAGILEAEVVTADGLLRVANEYQNRDLFWALRGGGGGTFGVVTRLTLATHPLPRLFGVLQGSLRAQSEEAFLALIERFCRFYEQSLNNEHWGEQFSIRPDYSIQLYLTCQGLDREQIERLWAPLFAWMEEAGAAHQTELMVMPAREMWNYEYWQENSPSFVHLDDRPDQPDVHYWWAANQAEVSMFWHTYQSRYVPLSCFQAALRTEFSRQLLAAARFWPVTLHINKGLAGCSQDAYDRGQNTSVNPVVYRSAALAILASGRQHGQSIDPQAAQQKVDRIRAAMEILRQAAPDSGSYANEADYFEGDWQRQFWGRHYPRLLEIKNKYDPLGLFHCHHGVGSEGWSADGMQRVLPF